MVQDRGANHSPRPASRIVSDSLLPPLRVPLCIKDGKNDDPFRILDEEDLVRKAACECPPDHSMDKRELLRVSNDYTEDSVQAQQTCGPEAGNPSSY